MEAQDIEKEIKERHKRHKSTRALGGVVIIGVGSALLARELGAELPSWLFTWQMILIVAGVYVGARHGFRGLGWMIPIVVGLAFMAEPFMGINIGQLIWPIVIICIGIAMIFRPKRRWNEDEWKRKWEYKWKDRWEHHYRDSSTEDIIDSTTVFGGVKKNIITKDFKGGDITTFFGGTDIDLMQADFTGKAVIDITQVFGGTKLLVPPHWQIKSEDMVCLFGAIEDKRPIRRDIVSDDQKILVIRGVCIFGGIDIKSY